ncbi:hypothetical protein [Streptomyces sp. DHE17-7]|uniref:hypothetical protein n=1 Tax=Streptomyces sp. DHE17-7 TaxID=2759949 RepID=UPI000EBD2CF2|nr:hypothetical protein [Streptomyces sp. DHE17-7]MBJ6623536.1 hypothetical protein [Streptomyces sp. DHE17-7]RIH58638.1 hypothetical protein D3C59_33905 [Streptomyces sp. SHP22-7]
MNETTTTTVLDQQIELRITGQPDVKNMYGSGHIRPTEVTIRYMPSGLHAYVYGRWIREDGEVTDAPCSNRYAAHKDDVSDWPDWLADLAKTWRPARTDRKACIQQIPTPAETAPADESPHVYMDAVQDSAAWAYALTKAGQIPEALEHVEAMERLLAVYRRAVGA